METLIAENFEEQDLPFKVNRISPNIGAELLEIDLRKDLDKKTYKSIYQALLIYKVIFFREQNLSTEEHLKFAKNFGELEVHPFAPHKEGFPEVLSITHNEKVEVEKTLGTLMSLGGRTFPGIYFAHDRGSSSWRRYLIFRHVHGL